MAYRNIVATGNEVAPFFTVMKYNHLPILTGPGPDFIALSAREWGQGVKVGLDRMRCGEQKDKLGASETHPTTWLRQDEYMAMIVSRTAYDWS